MLDAYETGLRWVLRHQALVLGVAVATLVATVWLYVLVPKGLLPQQDTGMILGITDAAQTISFPSMVATAAAVAEAVLHDPDVVNVASFVGGGTVNPTMNTGRLYINLKPRDQRSLGVTEIIERLKRDDCRSSRASPCSCRRSRTCRSTAASAAPNTNTPCRTPMKPNFRNGPPGC